MIDSQTSIRPEAGSFRRGLAVLLLLLALLGVAWAVASRPSVPGRISVRYLSRIDRPGNTVLRIAVTNVGESTVFTWRLGELETRGNSNRLTVGMSLPVDRLRPGEGMVTDCQLSDADVEALSGHWRLTFNFGDSGLRSQIYAWQWGAKGPGPKVNWLIPQFLKGMPLSVIGRTDWHEPVPPQPTVASPVQH